MTTKHKIGFALACFFMVVLLICTVILVNMVLFIDDIQDIPTEGVDLYGMAAIMAAIGATGAFLVGVSIVALIHGLLAMVFFASVLFADKKPMAIRIFTIIFTSVCALLLCGIVILLMLN